jgi:hypothetical protein
MDNKGVIGSNSQHAQTQDPVSINEEIKHNPSNKVNLADKIKY